MKINDCEFEMNSLFDTPVMPEIKTKLMLVSPALAEKILAENPSNRPYRPALASKYAREIEAGKWRISHQGIGIGWNKRLLDGQHRLRAIILSGIPVMMNVTTGIDPDAFIVMDSGAARSRSDVLSLDGIPVAISKIISSAIPWCINYQSGSSVTNKSFKNNSNENALAFFRENKGLKESAEFTLSLPHKGKLLVSSITCFAHYQIKKNGGKADQFFTELLIDGATGSSMILEMRRMLIMNLSGSARMIDSVIAKRIIVCYNRWSSGKAFSDPRQILGRVSIESSSEEIK